MNGPSMVIAGAGSGKTRVLTYRIAHLLDQGIHPSSILALTFTNKAAREMQERIDRLTGPVKAGGLWMNTFHSIFARILRIESRHLGYSADFTIYDNLDSRNLVKSIIRELDLNDEYYRAAEIHRRISSAKNNLVTPGGYLSNESFIRQDQGARRPATGDIYRTYAYKCRQSGAMDFDDLLLNTYLLFRDHHRVLKTYQERFRYILVDEYQDTNFAQYSILKQLSYLHKNIFVVGDDAQSIYSFRGARIENILNFRNDFPAYKLFKLEQNYRSTRNIVDAANSLISRNRGQISKQVWSDNETGEKVSLFTASTDIEEGYKVAGRIRDIINREQLQYQDIAVLYRTNAQSRIFEEALRKINIPYKVYGSLSFFQRKEIKDVLAYLRMAVNPLDEESLKRVINYPQRGIGKTTLSRLQNIATGESKTIWEVLQDIERHSELFNKGIASRLRNFRSLISGFNEGNEQMEAFDLAYAIVQNSGIMKEFRDNMSHENRSKLENINELLNSIRGFTENQKEQDRATLNAYLQNAVLLTDADREKPEDRNRVTLLTAHAAKGLEFKHVFITGLEEDLFPSRLSVSDPKEIEEERRLFYVALTRSMKHAHLSHSRTRMRWGIPVNCFPSRFIGEIDPKYLHARDEEKISIEPDTPSLNFPRPKKTRTFPDGSKQSGKGIPFREDTADPDDIQVGMEVIHPRFGAGKVLSKTGSSADSRATVFFRKSGQKQLLLRFARLTIVR